MTAVIVLTMLSLLAAGPLMRLIGDRLEAMVTRILGVILAALAVEVMAAGLTKLFPALGG